MPTWRFPVNLTYPDGGGPGVNVWHIRATGATPVETNLQSMVDAIHAFYQRLTNSATAGADWYQGGTTISADSAVDVDTSEASDVDWTTIGPTPAAAAAAPVLAVCVTWRTSLRARRGMGRTFIGPLNAAVVQDNGTPAEAYRDVLSTACQELINTSTSFNNGAVGIYGRENAGGAGSHVIRDLTGFLVPNEFAVLRSRRD